MSSKIPITEPSSVYSGDTVTWSRSLSDYPATAGWILSYALLSSAAKITIIGTASGADHLINVAPAITSTWIAGDYAWQSYVTKGTDRFTVGGGTITIQKNFASLTASETRNSSKIILDAIDATIKGTATDNQKRIRIGDTELDKHPIPDLLKLRDYYKTEVRRDEQADRINNGQKAGNRILVRFN